MQINKLVDSLCKKYKTRNPFEIASCKNIIVIYEPLGNIKGYYNQCYRQKIIHINESMHRQDQLFTCAHELGHALMHPKSNTPFLHTNTLFCVGKFEKEANYFAVDLVYSDEYMKELISFSTKEIAMCLNISENLVKYRLSNMKIELPSE